MAVAISGFVPDFVFRSFHQYTYDSLYLVIYVSKSGVNNLQNVWFKLIKSQAIWPQRRGAIPYLNNISLLEYRKSIKDINGYKKVKRNISLSITDSTTYIVRILRNRGKWKLRAQSSLRQLSEVSPCWQIGNVTS